MKTERISVEKFEEYTCNGELFSVEDAAEHFGVTKAVIRVTAHRLGYSRGKAKLIESI